MPSDEEFRIAVAGSSRWNGPRPRPLAYSLVLHSAAAFALLWFSDGANPSRDDALRDQPIEQPHERIIWYHLKEIPRISSATADKNAPTRAERLNPDVIIYQAPDAAHTMIAWYSALPSERLPSRRHPHRT